jgi:hypothetical protein
MGQTPIDGAGSYFIPLSNGFFSIGGRPLGYSGAMRSM